MKKLDSAGLAYLWGKIRDALGGKLTAPTPTSSDNGKFLRVVNGEAVWQTVPSAEGGSY